MGLFGISPTLLCIAGVPPPELLPVEAVLPPGKLSVLLPPVVLGKESEGAELEGGPELGTELVPVELDGGPP